jgi:hypothetical protein
MHWMKTHLTDILQLLNFCYEHQHMRVDLRLPGFALNNGSELELSRAVVCGIVLACIFKGTDISSIQHGIQTVSTIDQIAAYQLGPRLVELRMQAARATNLRIVPTDRLLDGKEFRREI